jgi:hypothetical protein
MNSADDRLALLAVRRAQLVRHAAEQRQQLGIAVAPLARALSWVERGIYVWALVRQRPWLIAAPVALIVWWRSRGLGRVGAALVPVLWRMRAVWGPRS